MQASGYKGTLLIDYETTFKTNPASPDGRQMPFNTLELGSKQNLIVPATITGTRNPVEPARGRISVDGSITIPIDYRALGFWLKAIFGAPTTSGTSPNYSHVYKPGTSQPSLVVEKGYPDLGKYFLFNGCKVGSFKMAFGEDSELVATMDLMGAKETINTSSYDATPTAVVLDRVNNFQASIKEGGSTSAIIKSGEINISTGLDGDQYIIGGNGERGDIPEGILEISGTLKALFTDTVLLAKGQAGTESSLEVVFTYDVNKSLTFKFPEIQFERTSPPISGPAGVMLDLNWRGYYNNNADGASVVVTLANDQAAY